LSKLARRLSILALFLCLTVGILFVTQDLWLRALGRRLVYSDPPCKADLILVLAGDFTGSRAIRAAELLQQGWAPKAMFSGAGTIYGVNEGDLALAFLQRSGLPLADWSNNPNPARSTAAEALYNIPRMRSLGVHRFILVTSNFHTRRAAAIYRKAAPDLPFCVVAAPDPDFDPDNWWHDREGRKTAFFEWCKTLATSLGL